MEPIMSDQATAFSLVGETALVTGATRGIGREAALALARAGANVAAGCRDRDAGEGLAAEIRALGVRGAAVSMDLTDFASIPAAVDAAEAALGPLSILVNNAGHSRPAPSLDVGIADFDAMFDLNVKGAFFAAQARNGHQCRLAGGSRRAARRVGLLHDEGRDDSHDPVSRRRMGASPDQGERGRAHVHPHRQHPALARRPGVSRFPARAHSARPRGRAA
jgi:NAD(P)-dependent dehydrogenase (short-subunit alcohol dehydrogenase family)